MEQQSAKSEHFVPCPNKCEVGTVPRCDIEKHRAECPLEPVACEFADVGCNVKVARRDLSRHMEESQQQHLLSATLLNLRLTKAAIAEKDRQLAEKDIVIAAKDQQISELQTQLRRFQLDFMESTKVVLDNFIGANPHNLLLRGFSQLQGKREGWLSTGFYSYIGGHKLKLHVETKHRTLHEGQFSERF